MVDKALEASMSMLSWIEHNLLCQKRALQTAPVKAYLPLLLVPIVMNKTPTSKWEDFQPAIT